MSDFYNINTVLRRNAVISVCCGGRGIGKSYSAKVRLVKDWLAKGWQFVYVRRYRDDLVTFNTFFNDIGHLFPDWEFDVFRGTARARRAGTQDPWEVMGYSVALSVSHKLKSGSYPNVHWMLFDEFIAPPESRYVSNEVTVLYELYSTLDRYQDRVRVIMLANSISLDNPYFNKWGFTANSEFEKYGGNFVVCHYPESKKFNARVAETRFGKFITQHAQSYANYAMGNVFADRSDVFIEPRPANATPAMAIRTPETEITLYICPDRTYNVSVGMSGDDRYALECVPRNGEKPMARNSEFLRILKSKWYSGSLKFNTSAARSEFRKLL